jgi:hypothetical protein
MDQIMGQQLGKMNSNLQEMKASQEEIKVRIEANQRRMDKRMKA